MCSDAPGISLNQTQLRFNLNLKLHVLWKGDKTDGTI